MIKDINKLLKRSLSFNQRTIPLVHKSNISQKDFYVIECHGNSFCLREELKSYKLQEDDHVQVIGGELNHNDPNILNYLWLFKQNENENQYMIIHARTDLSLSSDDYQVELEHGSLYQKQTFIIQEVKPGVFRIRDHNENFLTLDGILQSNQFMERETNQQFLLKKVKQVDVDALKGTGFILCTDKSKAIDLTNASRLNQNQIILYEPNFRMNQRWLFQGIQPEKEELYLRQSIERSHRGKNRGHKIYIRNALTEHYMSYNREHHQLMQSSYPEEWRLEPILGGMSEQNNGQFHIQHIKQHKYLSFKAETYELRLSKQPCTWVIPNHEWALSYAYKDQPKVIRHISI